MSYGFFFIAAPNPDKLVKSKDEDFDEAYLNEIYKKNVDGFMLVIMRKDNWTKDEYFAMGYRIWIRYYSKLKSAYREKVC